MPRRLSNPEAWRHTVSDRAQSQGVFGATTWEELFKDCELFLGRIESDPLTNLTKLLYPGSAFTKAQVIDYYIRIAPLLPPHFAGRAVTMLRFPDGVAGKAFYEKDAPKYTPE